ncbi:coiled-coil domain-containing protein [Halapricum desulfuricans]|uniref:Chromosome segregation ATPase n=1 Tax=Halapricum desulfuricans TaxID=2841257 RepID=A0A897N7G0_9EURY|nr:hypothetical protein [Halapricum desulfuricans]QSG08484.1 Uncharacterized protein HSR122_1083 [Halapricum desulfuricans]
MTTFTDRFDELTHEMEVLLDEDLASIQKMPEQTRLERYNSLKSDEEEFVWEFAKEFDQLTGSEREDVRAKFRLARLLIAASFYEEGSLPRAMRDDFVETELQAVVDFERYKRFDVLTEEEIEAKIRRMDGEVYELVTEYTSTQIANMDELMDEPDVQSDVMRKLLDRYQERCEKIRQGFFVYVETHGLEHMVESIEAAVQAVSESADEREAIQAELREEIQSLSESLEADFRQQQRTFEAQLQQVEHEITSQTVDSEQLQSELQRLEQQGDSLTEQQEVLLEEFGERIERTSTLETRLSTKIEQLEEVQRQTREEVRKAAREETTAVVEEELAALREQREQLQAEIDTLERERESIEVARERLGEKQQRLSTEVDGLAEQRATIEDTTEKLDETEAELAEQTDRLADERDELADTRDQLKDRQRDLKSEVEDAQQSLSAGDNTLPDRAISTSMARLLEMDYVGRFDTSMHDAESVVTTDGTVEIPDGYWADRSEHLNDQVRLDQLLDADGTPEKYPLDRRARYFVTGSGLLGLRSRRKMVIEAAIKSNLEAHATNGFDAAPRDLDDLLNVVNDAVYEAQQNDYHYLLGVASPTGWTDRVIRQVEGGNVARSRYSRHLSLVLVDLQHGDIYYDDSDEIASENSDLYEIPVTAERVDKAVDVIRSNYIEEVGIDSVLLEEVVEEQGFDVRETKEAFDRLAESGVGEQLHIDEYGLALDVS